MAPIMSKPSLLMLRGPAPKQGDALSRRTCRIATLNCGTLPGRLPAVLALAEKEEVDILVLQETRLSKDSMPAFPAAVREAGWTPLLDAADEHRKTSGDVDRGVVALCRWPVAMDMNPLREEYPGRFLFFRAYRQEDRPVRIGGLYLDAHDEEEAAKQAMAAVAHLRSTGDDFIAIGDWNLVREQQPLVQFEITKRIRMADDCASPETVTKTGPARTIDYAIHSSSLARPLQRAQCVGVNSGPAAHQMVYYDWELGTVPNVLRRPPRKRLKTEEVPLERWRERLGARADLFARPRHPRDAAARMLALLDSAEEVLTDQDFIARPRLPRRSRPAAPTQHSKGSTRAKDYQSVKERQLRRLGRKFRQLERSPGDNLDLIHRISTLLHCLQGCYPEVRALPWDATGAETLDRMAEECALLERLRRFEGWSALMEEDEIALRQWAPTQLTQGPVDARGAQRPSEPSG